MVCPDDEPEEGDAGDGVNHRAVAKDRLASEAGDDVGGHAHRRQDHDVNGRVRIEPEQVLVKDWESAAGGPVAGVLQQWELLGNRPVVGQEKAGEAVVIQQVERQGAGQHRCGKQHQDRGDKQRPGGQRHAEHGHAGGAELDNRAEIIHHAHDAGETQQNQAQEPAGLAVEGHAADEADEEVGCDGRDDEVDNAIDDAVAQMNVVVADVSEARDPGGEIQAVCAQRPGARVSAGGNETA